MKKDTLLILWMAAATFVAAGCNKTGDDGTIHASGHIEATDVRLAAKVGGRLLEAPLEEGDRVATGELVARFETIDADHRLAQARAQVEAADAKLRLLLAGSRAEDLRRAEDQLAQAQAELDAARRDLTVSPAWPSAARQPRRHATMPAPDTRWPSVPSLPPAPNSTSWSPGRADRRSRRRAPGARRPRPWWQRSSSRSMTPQWLHRLTV